MKWNDISDPSSDFINIPLNVDLYVLVEHDPHVEWGNDDTTPFVIKVRLEKSINPEYIWRVNDYKFFDSDEKIIPQDFTVVAWRNIK